MMQREKVSRRTFLKGALAGVAVVGFDRHTRRWLDWAGVQTAVAAVPTFPTFDGTLYMDPGGSAQLDAAADDFGHIVSHRPVAVLDPGSINDIVVMVQFARQHDIKVSARGQGHSTQGQAQNDAGVVINMSPLNAIYSVSASQAHVQGGVMWRDLAAATTALGYTPPTLPDYVELSVGGTLSVGGIGGQGFISGPLVDNVAELTVVTGAGNLVTCSPTQNKRLFDAVRAGLGQVGIIVEARINLAPAPATVRFYNLPYLDVNTMMTDQAFLINTNRFDYVEGFALDNNAGGWIFILEAVKYNGTVADDATVLAGLNFLSGGESMENRPFFNPAFDPFNAATYDFVNRVAILVETILKPFGLWGFPHPWFNAFLPSTTAYTYIGNLFSTIVPSDLGPGGVAIIYPFKGDSFNAPLLMTPNGAEFFTVELLKTVPPVPALVSAAIAHNAQLRDGVVAAGGKRYPIDSVPMTKQDWQEHFQPNWGQLVSAKHLFDPDNLLASGQGIF